MTQSLMSTIHSHYFIGLKWAREAGSQALIMEGHSYIAKRAQKRQEHLGPSLESRIRHIEVLYLHYDYILQQNKQQSNNKTDHQDWQSHKIECEASKYGHTENSYL